MSEDFGWIRGVGMAETVNIYQCLINQHVMLRNRIPLAAHTAFELALYNNLNRNSCFQSYQ